MCVPDLSTCESCTNPEYNSVTSSWSVNCCDTKISGYVFTIFVNESPTYKSHSIGSSVSSGHVVYACMMTQPFVAPYMYVDSLGPDKCTSSAMTGQNLAKLCANNVQPKCFVTNCREYTTPCLSGGGHAGGAGS